MSTFYRSILACLIISIATCAASAQEEANDKQRAPASAQQPQTAGSPRTTADENFELNISERRITRRNFEASTSVEAGEESARGLRLRIGVAVGADSIDVLLRNVRGQVRFRASLERVLDRINARQQTNTSP